MVQHRPVGDPKAAGGRKGLCSRPRPCPVLRAAAGAVRTKDSAAPPPPLFSKQHNEGRLLDISHYVCRRPTAGGSFRK